MMNHQQQMIEMCKVLRLPSIRQLLQDENIFKEYPKASDFLYYALTKEQEDRQVRARTNRIRLAQFPEKKLLEELEMEALPQNAAARLPIFKRTNLYYRKTKRPSDWLSRYRKDSRSHWFGNRSLFGRV